MPLLKVGLFFLTWIWTSPVNCQNQRPEFADNLASCLKERRGRLNFCLRNTLEELRPFMQSGIPELGVIPVEPLLLDHLDVDASLGKGLFDLRATLDKVSVHGLSSFVVRHLDVDPLAGRLELTLWVPGLNLTGLYQLRGRVMIAEVTGRGPFEAHASKVTGKGKARINAVDNDSGRNHLSISDVDVNFDVSGSTEVRMENLFDGKYPLLAKAANGFVSRNGKRILDFAKPYIRAEVNHLIGKVFNDALSKVPMDDIVHEFVN